MAKVRYWDSVTFLGWFKGEKEKHEICRGVVAEAEKGKIRIVTSAITLTEVIKLKGERPLERDEEEKIRSFFELEYIDIRVLDRPVAELARELIWQYPKLKPKDAIHVATAVRLKIPILDTFDQDLISLDRQIGNPPLCIGRPDIPYQESIFSDPA